MQEFISSKMCVFAAWPVWWKEETKMCMLLSCIQFIFFLHSFFQWCSFFMHHVGDAWNIWMDCLELWVQITILWKWRYRPFSKVSSVCQCVPGDFYKKRTSELSQMWLSSLWEMWYSMFTHFEDHRWNWSYNDKNTTLEGVSRAFWISRIKSKSQTHERYFYSADWWRYGCSNFWWESTQGE